MIRQIRGTVLSVEPNSLVVEVSGFGLQVHYPGAIVLTPGTSITILTYLAIKQDGMELYGFADAEDRRFFEQLLTVSGVGPKTALSIMVRASRESLETAIAGRDITYLTRVVGLGKKAAEKLAVELSEKVSAATDAPRGDDAEVFDTLVALGYTEREARKAVGGIPMHVEGREARLKAALSAK
jgi:Holliday junction DNA helicase RuvA